MYKTTGNTKAEEMSPHIFFEQARKNYIPAQKFQLQLSRYRGQQQFQRKPRNIRPGLCTV